MSWMIQPIGLSEAWRLTAAGHAPPIHTCIDYNPIGLWRDKGMFDRLLKWLPALITGLIIGFAVVLFSHRRH